MNEVTVGGADTKDLKIDKVETRVEFENFADNKEISASVTTVVDEYIKSFEALLDPEFSELDHYDYMYRCGRNATEASSNDAMAKTEDPRSDVGASMFFRQVMQSAAKTYSLQHGRDSFFKYVPISTKGVVFSDEDGAMQASQMNTLSKWNLDQIGFDERVLMPLNISVARLGVGILMADWVREQKLITVTIPSAVDPETGAVAEKNETIEINTLVKNHMDVKLLNVQSCRFDPSISAIQDQECFAVTNVIGLSDVVQMVKSGYWSEEQFLKLSQDTRWDGESGDSSKEATSDNFDIGAEANNKTGKFLMWRVWVNLPIADGKMDEKTIIPERYVCDFIGNTIDASVCMRIERNDDPDDEIPAEAVYDYPDVDGRFFHISKGHVLKNNYAVEVTAINQMIDGVSLAMNPPTIEKKGAIVKRPQKYSRNERFVVRNSVNEDIRELVITDKSQTSLMLLNYIRDDSKMAVHTDPAQMGEGLGARATATEASGVMKLSAAPSVMNAKYITKQTFGWLGRKMDSYWKAFSLPEQVVRITDSRNPIQDVKPDQLKAPMDVRVDVVDEIVNDIMEENKISQDLQLFSTNQELGAMVDMQALLEEYFIIRYKKDFSSDVVDYDARSTAESENNMMMINGVTVKPEQTQNHRVHLELHKAERLRYRGVEAQYPSVQVLDNHIEAHTAMMGGGGQQVRQPEQIAPAPAGGAGTIPAQGLGGGEPPTVGAVTQKAVAQ